mmetsp:Transcript_1667/g.6061  ORF Transcript_1667/g.6061 Transcript_1667/m.6061 type:complete len:239 (+) Transcript_1667:673-1389(+)
MAASLAAAVCFDISVAYSSIRAAHVARSSSFSAKAARSASPSLPTRRSTSILTCLSSVSNILARLIASVRSCNAIASSLELVPSRIDFMSIICSSSSTRASLSKLSFVFFSKSSVSLTFSSRAARKCASVKFKCVSAVDRADSTTASSRRSSPSAKDDDASDDDPSLFDNAATSFFACAQSTSAASARRTALSRAAFISCTFARSSSFSFVSTDSSERYRSNFSACSATSSANRALRD